MDGHNTVEVSISVFLTHYSHPSSNHGSWLLAIPISKVPTHVMDYVRTADDMTRRLNQAR